MFIKLIYFTNSTFTVSKLLLTRIDVRNETNRVILLSAANVPVPFRAQQQAKYSSLQLPAKTRIELTAAAIFPSVFFHALQYPRQHLIKLFGSQGFSNDKTDLILQHFLQDLWILQFNCASAVSLESIC